MQELADRKFNLILVDSNGSNLDLLSKYLGECSFEKSLNKNNLFLLIFCRCLKVEKFKIETICVNLDDPNQLEDANKSKDIGILSKY